MSTPESTPLAQPSEVGWVALGGMIGTALRALVGLAAPSTPIALLVVNLLGAFGLATLLAAVRASDHPARLDRWRLLVGTGGFGGFTTYSGLAVATLAMPLPASLGYWAATLFCGLLASLLGALAGTSLAGRAR